MASAGAGLNSTAVLLYPGGVGSSSGFVRVAFTTDTHHLAADLRERPDHVSKFHSERLAALQKEYDDAVDAETPEEEADAAYKTRLWEVCVHSADLLALMNIAREVFGFSRSPNLTTYERQQRIAAAADNAGAGDDDGAGGAPPPLKLPPFLESKKLQKLWRKAWGMGCFQALALDRNELVWLVRFVCLSFERGEMVMYDKKVAGEWEKTRQERGDTCKSTTPFSDMQWMALCPAVLIPKGLVDVVCTPDQKAKAGVHPFVVRCVCVFFSACLYRSQR